MPQIVTACSSELPRIFSLVVGLGKASRQEASLFHRAQCQQRCDGWWDAFVGKTASSLLKKGLRFLHIRLQDVLAPYILRHACRPELELVLDLRLCADRDGNITEESVRRAIAESPAIHRFLNASVQVLVTGKGFCAASGSGFRDYYTTGDIMRCLHNMLRPGGKNERTQDTLYQLQFSIAFSASIAPLGWDEYKGTCDLERKAVREVESRLNGESDTSTRVSSEAYERAWVEAEERAAGAARAAAMVALSEGDQIAARSLLERAGQAQVVADEAQAQATADEAARLEAARAQKAEREARAKAEAEAEAKEKPTAPPAPKKRATADAPTTSPPKKKSAAPQKPAAPGACLRVPDDDLFQENECCSRGNTKCKGKQYEAGRGAGGRRKKHSAACQKLYGQDVIKGGGGEAAMKERAAKAGMVYTYTRKR
eukprot:COSAG04_NODE_574_length_12520_cov_55.989936_10_plen_428_part_00